MAVPDTSAYQKLFRLVELVRPYQKLFRLAGPAVPIKNFSDWLLLSWYLGLDVAKVLIGTFKYKIIYSYYNLSNKIKF